MKPMHLLAAAWAIVSALLAEPSAAATLDLAPVSHELTAARPSLSMTVTNRGATSVTVQVRGFAWDQDGGEDRLQSAPEVIVSPPIFSLAPGQTQVLRAMVQGLAAERERSYRLLLDELPSEDDRSPVRMALRLSVPVFVKPVGDSPAVLGWALGADGRSIQVGNSGGSRQRVHRLELVRADGQRLAATATGPYVLAGAQRRWSLGDDARALKPGETVRVSALTDAGRIEVPLVVAP